MPRLQVHSKATTPASAEQAWSLVRDFCAPWHPLVESMTAERDDGGLVRRFTVDGDDTVYRERLTWFSDSERAMSYRHVEGIAGVERYDGHLSVAPAGPGAEITMSADILAGGARAEEIAHGTQAVFDAGTSAVATLAQDAKPEGEAQQPRPEAAIRGIKADGNPELALNVSGGKSGTLCLFLHGIGGNKSNWDSQLGAIAPVCRAAALDLRGYGGSSSGQAPTTIGDYIDDILRVADTLEAGKFVLCGLSYGAWIAASFAVAHPARLSGLALAGGCTGMSEAGAGEIDAIRRNRIAPLEAGKTPADIAPDVVEIIAGPGAGDAARTELLKSMQAIPAPTYADALRCFTNPPGRLDLSRITMPVLLMTGEADRLAPPGEIRGVARRIWEASPHPDVRFEVVGGAGHVCNLERPGACNRILGEFIARVIG